MSNTLVLCHQERDAQAASTHSLGERQTGQTQDLGVSQEGVVTTILSISTHDDEKVSQGAVDANQDAVAIEKIDQIVPKTDSLEMPDQEVVEIETETVHTEENDFQDGQVTADCELSHKCATKTTQSLKNAYQNTAVITAHYQGAPAALHDKETVDLSPSAHIGKEAHTPLNRTEARKKGKISVLNYVQVDFGKRKPQDATSGGKIEKPELTVLGGESNVVYSKVVVDKKCKVGTAPKKGCVEDKTNQRVKFFDL